MIECSTVEKFFLSYMSKALRYEMRDAVKTSNEAFKIKANLNFEESRAQEIESYLTEIEYSSQVSPEWHLKKKLACVLKPVKAYSLLKAYRAITIEKTTAKIYLHEAVQLSQLTSVRDKLIVQRQIKTIIYRRFICLQAIGYERRQNMYKGIDG